MPVCAYLVYLFVVLECVLGVRESGYPTPHLPLAMFWIKHSICSLPSCCVLQQVHLYTLSLSHRRSFYSSPSRPDMHTLSDPPQKTMFIHTCSHTCGCQSQSHSMQSDSCRLPAKASQRTKA